MRGPRGPVSRQGMLGMGDLLIDACSLSGQAAGMVLHVFACYNGVEGGEMMRAGRSRAMLGQSGVGDARCLKCMADGVHDVCVLLLSSS